MSIDDLIAELQRLKEVFGGEATIEAFFTIKGTWNAFEFIRVKKGTPCL